jgi:hypothetical protein
VKVRTVPVALLLLGSPAAAQTVDEVVTRYLAARGGLERIRSVESLRMTGTITPAPNQQGAFQLELKRPAKMRVDTTIQGSGFTQATDGETAWVQAPMLAGGKAVLLPPSEAQPLKDQADIDGPLVDWRKKGHAVELTGRETRFGGEALRLKVRLKSGDVRYLYIDAKTYRQVAEEGERPTPRGLMLIETRLSDHREVDGLVVPFTLEIDAGGQERQRVAFQTVDVNPKVDDARFAAPAGARPPPTPPAGADRRP